MKLKHLSEFTLKEYEQYTELIKEEVNTDWYTILKLFSINIDTITTAEMKDIQYNISEMTLEGHKVKSIYNIKGKRFKTHLNLKNIKASQFIDFQTYITNFKLHEILSVFLIPQTKKLFKWSTPLYNTGYDILEVQKYLYENFTIGEANELAVFFFNQSSNLLEVMKDYLVKKELKMRMNYQREILKAVV